MQLTQSKNPRLFPKIQKMLSFACFILNRRHFKSPKILNSLHKNDRKPNDTKKSTMLPPIPEIGEVAEQVSTTDTKRVLGTHWSVFKDILVINSKTCEKFVRENNTQIKILKSVSAVHDPIWFFVHFSV